MKLTDFQAIVLLFAAAGLASLASVPIYDGCVASVGLGWLSWIACPLGASAIGTAIMAAAAILILSAVNMGAGE